MRVSGLPGKLIVLGSLLLLFGGGAFVLQQRSTAPVSPTMEAPVLPATELAPSTDESPPPLSLPLPSAPQPAASRYFFPTTDYAARLTKKWYGKRVVPADQADFACGDAFFGFHTGDDLEARENELHQELPVFAIADGVARQVGRMSGYGGLIVIEHELAGDVFTVYYGHIALGSTTLRAGAQVTAGQRLARLGNHCSTETDGERKHLHFAIRRGTTINVRGYVGSEAELAAWVNPKEMLEKLEAQSPES
jgi:murein DD-endopeptidase MepM/ murein hydrolase activator NlpD